MTGIPEKQNEPTAPQTEENNNDNSNNDNSNNDNSNNDNSNNDNIPVDPAVPQEPFPESQIFSDQELPFIEPIIEGSEPPLPSSLRSTSRGRRQNAINKTAIVGLLAICLLAGSLVGYAATYSMFNDKLGDLQIQLSHTEESFNRLNSKIADLQIQLQVAQSNVQNSNNNNIDMNANSITNSNTNSNMGLAEVYQTVRASVVVVQCIVPQYNLFGFQTGYSNQQGSGFVTSVNGQQVVVTNNHVINSGSNITVTFADMSSYTATVLGADVYADLAVLKVNNMPSGVSSLTLVSSSNSTVGDTVAAVGSPYGLSGTLTTGIISSLGRTITETINNRRITIPDIIQTTAEINPGNSGGPLINLKGQVVGITTASVSNSQGLGFAVPSDTIMREIESLINTGKYAQHPALGVSGRDMTLQIAQSMNIDITYGWLVETATESSGLKSGDVIIKAGSTAITNLDDLLSYLERNTLPGQNVEFTVIRDRQQQTVTVHIIALNTN